jgi:hypothetical protein
MNSPDFTEALHMRFSRSKDQVFTDLNGEVVLLNVKTGKYFNLNPIGSVIWQMIAEPTSLSSIVSAITAEYDVDPQRCEQDVRNLLHKMQLVGLIHITSDTLDVKTGPL